MNKLEKLNALVWQEIASRKDVVTARRVDIPDKLPGPRIDSESRFSKEFPVLNHLENALNLSMQHQMHEIGFLFAELADRIRWSQNPGYTLANTSQSFLDGYCYAGLSGPGAPILCAVPLGGFVLLGPDVHYQSHKHAPREVYLVMTPGSEWCLDDGAWFGVAPGDLIFHDSWQAHAMRSRDQPLLAYAGWLDIGDRRAINWSDNCS